MLKFLTLNNVLNQKLLTYADQGYYVIYLILSQVGNEEAINTKLKLKDILSTKVKELSVDFKLLKDQGFKIPLAICKLEDLAKTTFNFQDCLDPYYEVQEISYRNNHFFSNQTNPIRKLNNYIFVIEGNVVSAVGSSFEEKAWYLR